MGFRDDKGLVRKPLRIVIFMCILSMALVGSCFLYYHSPEEKLWLICPFYRLSGYYCPGCGSGRACYSILHGRIYQAFRYNPLLCVLLPWFALYIAVCAAQWVMYGRETVSRRIPVWLTYVLLAAVILYGVFRNIRMAPFVLLAPTKV